MKIDTIENFISNSRQSYTSSNSKTNNIEIVTSRNEKPKFDITREINNRTFIRPLPPKGHIIQTGILNAPLNYFNDFKDDIKAISSAWKGNANDYQLGKLNDFGMKLGGLAIAGYLFSKRQTPITKVMEFIGLGSFFASMALWPKIALDIPAKLIHGFSPFAMYEDSEGRKKRFFTDNQYIPFDMLSYKDINRIGHRLGVPKNQVNYREAVQEKMRQIALQNNTMWMLTAGFATPVMSALICNFSEPYVQKTYNSYLNKRINRAVEKFSDYTKNFKSKNITEEINHLVAVNDNKPINKELTANIAKILAGTLGPNIESSIAKDLDELLTNEMYKIPETHLASIHTRIKTLCETEAKNILSPETIKKIIPTEEQINNILTENSYYNKPLSKPEIHKIIHDISEILSRNVTLYNKNVSEDLKIQRFEQIKLSAALHKPAQNKDSHTLENILIERPATNFDSSAQRIVKKLANLFSEINAEHNALSTIIYKKLAYAPNTLKANYWSKTTNSLLKTLNITKDEIQITHYDRKLVGELINKKIWQMATSSEEEYKCFIKNLAHDISQIENVIKPLDRNSSLFKQMQSTYSAAANALRNFGFNRTANSFIKPNGDEIGTLFGASRSFINNNLTNLAATFSSIINKANIYRTIYKNPNLEFINAQSLPKEIKEEIVGLIEYLTTEGRISDYSVKFDFLRNLTPNQTVSKLEIEPKNGIKYAFYNAEKRACDGVQIKSDIEFFRKVMTAMFDTPIDSETTTALSEYSFVSDILTKYRKNMIDHIANIENFMYPELVMKVHKKNGLIDKTKTYTTTTPKNCYNSVGTALDEVFTNAIKQKYNTGKWLKMFGSFGIGLYLLTVVSQFFFGRGDSGKIKKGTEI